MFLLTSPAQADWVLLCGIAGKGVIDPVAKHGGVPNGVNHDGGLEVVIELGLPSAIWIHSERKVDLYDVRKHNAVRKLKLKGTHEKLTRSFQMHHCRNIPQCQ